MKAKTSPVRRGSSASGRSWFGHLTGLDSEFDLSITDLQGLRQASDIKRAAKRFREWLKQFRCPHGEIAVQRIIGTTPSIARRLRRDGWKRDNWGAWMRDGVDLRSPQGRSQHPRAHTLLVAYEWMSDLEATCADSSDENAVDLDTAFRAGVIFAEAMVYSVESRSMTSGHRESHLRHRKSTISREAIYVEMLRHEQHWLRDHPGRKMQNADFRDVSSLRGATAGALSTRVWRYRTWKKSQGYRRVKSLQ